jgi:hypothetical protein
VTIRWEEITFDNPIRMMDLFKLYDQSFPIEERESHDKFFKGFEYAGTRMPNNFHCLVGSEGEHLVSFASGHYMSDVNSGFIVYIAVVPDRQNRGAGTSTLLKFEELLSRDAVTAGNSPLKAIILETVIQELVDTEEEKEECSRRNKFYEKNNYLLFDNVKYMQPPLHGGNSPLRLNLLIKNLLQKEITENDVRKFIQSMYKEKYYLINDIDKNILKHCLGNMGIGHAGLFD